MTTPIEKASASAQGMLEDLRDAERIIRKLTHQLEVTGSLTIENSQLESLVGNALSVSCAAGEWIKDVIARATDEVEQFNVATQNAKPQNVSRHAEVQP